MRTLTALAALAALTFAGGCLDLPVDDWERGRDRGPGYRRTRTYRAPGYAERETESVEVIPGTAPTTGTTNIYYGSFYPNGYAQPVYVVPAYPAYGYGYGGSPYYRRGGSYFNVNASGKYKGVNYNVGYGGGGGYGYGAYGTASGTKGKTSWSASYGYPYGGGYGGRQSYGIYGNGNNGNQGSNVTPSRFSVYR